MSQPKEIRFRIKEIAILESTLYHTAITLPQETVFDYDINIEHRINSSQGLLDILCRVTISTNQKEHKAGSITTVCVFEVLNAAEIMQGENGLNLPEHFLITLNSITLSTTRGVMFAQFRGTYLHNAVLPVLDPKGFRQL